MSLHFVVREPVEGEEEDGWVAVVACWCEIDADHDSSGQVIEEAEP